MIPGSNLLDEAFAAIDTQTIAWRKYLGRAANSVGIFVPQYDADVNVEASVQAVQNDVYKQFSLDWQKDFRTLYLSQDVIDLRRDSSSDRFLIGAKLYQVTSEVPWFEIDGWVGLIVVRIDQLE